VEEIERAGQRAHLADPAETAAKRGRKRRAKTDQADCDLQLKLLLAGELPGSWIPPAPVGEETRSPTHCSGSTRTHSVSLRVFSRDRPSTGAHFSLRWSVAGGEVACPRYAA